MKQQKYPIKLHMTKKLIIFLAFAQILEGTFLATMS